MYLSQREGGGSDVQCSSVPIVLMLHMQRTERGCLRLWPYLHYLWQPTSRSLRPSIFAADVLKSRMI